MTYVPPVSQVELVERFERVETKETTMNDKIQETLKIEACARAAHEINRVYCQALGDYTQLAWVEAPQWQKTSAVDGVRGVLAGNGPAESHASWLAEKERNGWKYGPVKDADKKEHPCFVPYDELPPEQKQKDMLFVNAVRSMAAALGMKVTYPADRDFPKRTIDWSDPPPRPIEELPNDCERRRSDDGTDGAPDPTKPSAEKFIQLAAERAYNTFSMRTEPGKWLEWHERGYDLRLLWCAVVKVAALGDLDAATLQAQAVYGSGLGPSYDRAPMTVWHEIVDVVRSTIKQGVGPTTIHVGKTRVERHGATFINVWPRARASARIERLRVATQLLPLMLATARWQTEDKIDPVKLTNACKDAIAAAKVLVEINDAEGGGTKR